MDNIKLSRREREKSKHKQEILDSAIRLFSEKGFYNVSMQEIAEKSEFGVGTLYNFFESKEQLFVELMEVGIEKFGQLLIPLLDSEEAEEKKISDFIQAHIELMESNIELIKLYISQYGTFTLVNPMPQKLSNDLNISIQRKLEVILNTGIQKQIFRRVHAEIAALSLCATLKAFILESSENFDKEKAKDGFSKIENYFMNSVLNKNNDNNKA
ncbi:MAG: hypothetical protein A2Y10_19500 [Planctomycetes bacterium GWF2_41_51]|nr:MAG: hypothetical protein A2Y10_19500 [Planctomycetes bacterium GWF2_41_51]